MTRITTAVLLVENIRLDIDGIGLPTIVFINEIDDKDSQSRSKQ
jgi:hypothetical protein